MINSIALSSIVFDMSGDLYIGNKELLPDKSSIIDIKRRSTRTATLDGGSSLYDTGYSSSDRTITITVPMDKTTIIDALEYFVKTYSEMILILSDGAYKCNPQSFKVSKNAVCKLLIIEDA